MSSAMYYYSVVAFAVALPAILCSAQIHPDAAALLSLKSAWSDPDLSLSSWNLSTTSSSSSSPPCSWLGVSCDPLNSTVTTLSLANIRLHGTLSAAVANLSSLHTLTLRRTSLFGPIPDHISSLASLSSLDLSYNSFTGPFPSAALSNLSRLSYLNLEFNYLDGPLPSSAASWQLLPLFTLRLRSNRFNGSIPSSLFPPTDPPPPLQHLLLENNHFSGRIPPEIGNALRLQYLSAGHNSLSGSLPASITRLTRLSSLYLDYNVLTGGIPSDIAAMRRLVHLDLSRNELGGAIPDSLGQLPNLKTLNLSDNHFNGSVPPSLGNLSTLANLSLSNNNLSGQLPVNGVLSNFSKESFAGNPGLCGGPLSSSCPPTPSLIPNPDTPPLPPPPLPGGRGGGNKTGKIVAGSVAGAVALCLILSLVFSWSRRRNAARPSSSSAAARIQSITSPDLPPDPRSAALQKPKLVMFIKAFKYSYDEVLSHAGYCDTAHMAGKGRFATVFRADLPNGMRLAVKLFKNPVPPPAFEKEMVGLEAASAQFRFLLPIKGFYASPQECVVLYDFMSKGNLYDLLHQRREEEAAVLLDWQGRLAIAIGIAQAVLHLHRGSSVRVLHKDIKSSNVLLDEGLQPLLADYGLIGMVSDRPVVETPGYAAPELRSSRRYTEKTEVYSYGVVLLELLTGKKPVSWVGGRELSLVTWVLRLCRDGRGEEVVSAKLLPPEAEHAERALNLAVQCVGEHPAQRPTMSEVMGILDGLISAASSSSPLHSPALRPERPLLV